ncbi:nitronate monooxygenase [Actinoplanes auranticolor]|uniref:Oxidoreductase n=1 Tax=Actinoplanes auranticolor TaxID=47988 RepID=A0A919VPF0_9ACTN|nr:nitronate monooxygenase [Actinoplanes auranticolor]GIM63890.1 oxidoreductase [Actinoplanes auranticolor]
MLDGCERSVVVAPMAGGVSTIALVRAAAAAGTAGFLPAGYLTPEVVEAQLRELGEDGHPYGLNIFVPSRTAPDSAAVAAYRARLAPEADRYGVELPPLRLHDDDHFAAKVELAVAAAPAWVSFTFGIPDAAVVEALRRAGSTVLITVTDADEARAAVAAGADAVVAQGGNAGGHSATTRPASYLGDRGTGDLVREVRAAVSVPVVAAGGVGSAADVAGLLAAGATAVQVGTMFLLAAEAGTREAHRAALGGDGASTVVTRAFTGQPARGLRNRFTDTYSADAPIGYPAVHHLTAPIRAAAARAGDGGALHLWAGTAFGQARPGTCREILDRLS